MLTAVKVELGNGSDTLAFRKMSCKKENGGIIFRLSIKDYCLQRLLLDISGGHARVKYTQPFHSIVKISLFHLCLVRLTVVPSQMPTLLENFLDFFSSLSFF